MTKVTVHEDSGQNEATKVAIPEKKSVTDSKGRKIVLREIDPLQQARLVMGVGAEAAANGPYMAAFVFPVAMVERIDEDFYGFPANIAQVEAMLKTLGNEGMAAIMAHFKEEAEAAKSRSEAEQAAVKN